MPEEMFCKVQKTCRLIEAETKVRTTAKSTLQSVVVHVTVSSEGIELDDNSVLARGVTREA